MRVSNEKCKKAAKTKGLSLLKNFGISGFSYVANATAEPLGEVAFYEKRLANKKKPTLSFGLKNGLVIRK